MYLKKIIENELYKLKEDKEAFEFIDNKECMRYKELDFAINILERILNTNVEENKLIEIPLIEYKELLVIKGAYKELQRMRPLKIYNAETGKIEILERGDKNV